MIMAFGYKAHYGYFQNGITSGTTTIEEMTQTDQNKWFVVPETYTKPYVMVPPVAAVDLAQAHENGQSITEYLGTTLLPINCFNTVYQTYAAGTVQSIIDFMPSAFRECPNLLAREIVPHTLEGDLHRTCVYLYDINKVITDNNQVYNVTSDGKLVYAGQSWKCSCGNFSGYPNTQASVIFTAQAMDIENVGGYECNFIVDEVGHYLVYYNLSTETIDTDTWETKKNGTFGTEDPEWSRNPFDKDPYNPVNPGGGGSSKPGGGDGSFDFESENVVEIPDPEDYTSFSVTDFVSVYATRNESSLRSLAAYMWGNRFIDDLKPLKNDPFDVIIGLSIIPCNVTGTPSEVVLGNCHTEVYMNKVSSQFKRVECGTLNIKPLWDAYLDYRTKIDIYLPFIGFRRISPNDVFGHSLNVKYNVDIATGACLAFISRDGEVIASYGGNCAYQIPVTGENYSNIINGLIGAAASGISGALMGSAGAITGAIGSAINSLMQDPEIQRTGGMGGNTSYMSQRKPFLLFSAPNQCIPEMQNAIKGYPAFITRQLSVLHGFTIVDEIHLDGVGATDEEKNEIMNALKEGVIL